MKAVTPTLVRRTQQERREATVRKLLDAATEALIEVGYTNTSVQEICKRAGVSHGGLFRHFSSRIELLIRVADHVGDGLLALYRRDFERLRKSTPDELVLALKLLRTNTQSHLHQAWFELLMAARTDRVLHDALVPIWKRRDEATQQLAVALLPETARKLPDFPIMVDTMVTLFHGEAVDRFLRIDPQSEKLRMEWLLKLLELLLPKGNQA
ncbi:TetR/AcrR family transcriptional regulator [Nevskia soli]|uniref:TetR/AcrR family transcriptional regulator n=1 Tax=Nevskia soli TaxID=418856 RepID=UPI0004A742F7|nr:TetR/AcrR family transcriptional regulator [Nevskia soli]